MNITGGDGAKMEVGTMHHVQDIGKLLLQVQDDLNSLRSNLKNIDPKDQPGAVEAALSSVIAKAENDFRAKADVVLQSVLNNSVTTLPDINDKTSMYDEAERMSNQGSQHGDSDADMYSSLDRKKVQLFDPEQAARGPGRKMLASTFGVPGPPPGHTRDRGLGPGQKSKNVGKRTRKKTSKPGVIIDAKYRNDPTSIPPISEEEAAKGGIYELVNRGFVGSDADITAALPLAMMSTGAAPVHEWHEQFVRSSTYVSPFGFDASNLKLDVPQRPAPSQPMPEPASSPVLEEKPQQELQLSVEREPSPVPEDRETEAPRSYNEIMDEFSLHQFIIRKGKTLDTPEFQSFIRSQQANWGRISELIHSLEDLLAHYAVPLAYVDGRKLAALAEDELSNPTLDELLDTLVNQNQVRTLVAVPGRRFTSVDKETAAATLIQATGRMYIARKRFQTLFKHSAAALKIQRRWRVYHNMCLTRSKIEAVREERLAQWKAKQQAFSEEWPATKTQKRVIVHVASMTVDERQRRSIHNLSIFQNRQLSRLTDLADPNVDVVYLVPAPLPEEVRDYYTKLLAVGGVQNAASRFRFICPENYNRLPSQLSLAAQLLYSPRALKRIITFIGNRPAYIVPNAVGADDVRVSMRLKLPLLGPDDRLATLYSSKSGCKRIFASAQVNMPPAAYDIYSTDDCFQALTRLVVRYPNVKRWLFKMDDEFGGRGHAWIDMSHVNCTQEIQAFNAMYPNAAEIIEEDEEVAEASEDLRLRVKAELMKVVPRRVCLAVKTAYRSWDEYMDAFAHCGGVIEACPATVDSSPSANLFIEPTGDVNLVSTQEQLFGAAYCCEVTLCPATSLPPGAMRAAALAVGKVCYQKGITGYVGVDFVVFRDEHTDSLRLWAVDLNLRMTSSCCGFQMFSFLTHGGKLDPRTGTYSIGERAQKESDSKENAQKYERAFCYIDFLGNPKLSEMQHTAFFNLCRLRGISFDLKMMVGTAYKLVDSFVCGGAGLLCIEATRDKALMTTVEALDFIRRDVGAFPASMQKEMDWEYAEYNFLDIFKAIKEAAELTKKKKKKRTKETHL